MICTAFSSLKCIMFIPPVLIPLHVYKVDLPVSQREVTFNTKYRLQISHLL